MNEAQRRAWTPVITAVLTLAGGLALVQLPRFAAFGWILLNLSLFEVVGFVTIVIHECGHVLAGLAMGMRVWGVELGGGAVLGTVRILGVQVLFRRSLLGAGYTVSTCADTRYQRIRYAAKALGGPLANLLVVVALVALLHARTVWTPFPHGTHLYPIPLLLLSNLLVFALNIFPRMINTTHGRMASDGLRVFRALFGKLDFEALRASHRMRLAVAHLAVPDYAAARSAGLECLEDPSQRPARRANLLNLVAWADVMLSDPGLVPEALAYAREAIAIAPDSPDIQGTLGTLLVETGEYQEGMDLLRKSNEAVIYKKSRATNLCHVAIAHARLGEAEKARDTLREIESLDRSCPLLDRARAAVA